MCEKVITDCASFLLHKVISLNYTKLSNSCYILALNLCQSIDKHHVFLYFSFTYQHASRHQLHQSAQFPARQLALHPVMTPAANRDTNHNRYTTLPHLLLTRPRVPIAVPVPVLLPAALRLVATPCTISRLTPSGNDITPLNQRKERRNTISSVNITERTKK